MPVTSMRLSTRGNTPWVSSTNSPIRMAAESAQTSAGSSELMVHRAPSPLPGVGAAAATTACHSRLRPCQAEPLSNSSAFVRSAARAGCIDAPSPRGRGTPYLTVSVALANVSSEVEVMRA